MEIGTEISQKIRSAIKAKLVELGAYVDDELPDYIMVMVANKKNQDKMTEDLALFLGNNTEKFTSWLHSLLAKLQAISTESPITETENTNEKKKEQKVEKRKRNSSSEKAENKPASEPVKKKVAQEPAKEDAVEEPDGPAAEEEEQPEFLVRENTDEFSEEFKEEEKKMPTKPTTKATYTSTTETVASSVRPSEKSVVSEIARSSSGDQPSKKTNVIATNEDFLPKRDDRKITRTVTSSVRQSLQKRKLDQKENGVQVKRKPSSYVGSVIRKYTEEDTEEEYDPYNPAVGNVASIIKVTARRSSVPKSLQANRSLLLKAMTEAEKSISDKKKVETDKILAARQKERPAEKMVVRPMQHTPPKMPPSLSSKIRGSRGLELISKSRRQEILQKMQYTVENNKPVVTVKKPFVNPEYKPTPNLEDSVLDSRLVECAKPEEEEEERVEKDIDQEYEEATVPQVGMEEEEEVTDKSSLGIEHDEMEDKQEEDEEVGLQEPDVEQHITDPEIQQLLEGDEDYDFGLAEEEIKAVEEPPKPRKSMPVYYVEDNKRIVKEKLKPKVPCNPKFIVTLDGVDPETYDLHNEMSPSPEHEDLGQETVPQSQAQPVVAQLQTASANPSKITPPKIKSFNISLKDTDDEEEEKDPDAEVSSLGQPTKQPERCKFWPTCANGNSCQYHHPSVSCRTFPHCKFGEKCLYIHPNCKYDAKCTRKDCPFTHASKRGKMATVIHKIVPVPVPTSFPLASTAVSSVRSTTCKFFPSCTNMNCPFTHPKPCRYGMSCMNKTVCKFFHPPLPGKDKLTWSAKNKNEIKSESKTTTVEKSKT